jgi:branched-chain amino acid transport system ATP-binding protein
LATLEVRRLTASYGRARALFGVDLEVRPGEALALLGRNGAGKSTTLKAIMGLLPPDGGEALFGGTRLNGRQPFEIARLGLGYVPEDRRIFTGLTVEENLEAGRRPARAGLAPWTRARILGLFPALGGFMGRSAANISGGEQQMLTIARTLMGNPAVLLLDEPSEGLAPKLAAEVASAIVELKREGLAVLLCEQNVAFARRVADRACLLEQGKVTHAGMLDDFKEAVAP